jgi:hypothetical protein
LERPKPSRVLEMDFLLMLSRKTSHSSRALRRRGLRGPSSGPAAHLKGGFMFSQRLAMRHIWATLFSPPDRLFTSVPISSPSGGGRIGGLKIYRRVATYLGYGI